MKRLMTFIVFTLLTTALVNAQDLTAPPDIPSEAVYIPFPVAITVDGDLTDWESIPTVTVDDGPAP
jgi:hypothetical protein